MLVKSSRREPNASANCGGLDMLAVWGGQYILHTCACRSNTHHSAMPHIIAQHGLSRHTTDQRRTHHTIHTCLKPAQQAMSLMNGGKKMTLAVSVMGDRWPKWRVKEGSHGRKPAPGDAWHDQ